MGFDPRRFASDVADFHRASMRRGKTHPSSLLATATHDHKRGEDVRARLAVLSEIPQEWTSKLLGWIEQSSESPRRRAQYRLATLPFFSKRSSVPGRPSKWLETKRLA